MRARFAAMQIVDCLTCGGLVEEWRKRDEAGHALLRYDSPEPFNAAVGFFDQTVHEFVTLSLIRMKESRETVDPGTWDRLRAPSGRSLLFDNHKFVPR